MLRIGNGYDVHKLVEGRKLMLGGIEVPHTKGVLGHSDGDVLLHAITDAIIGALGLGDIGLHFPDNDENLKDIDSATSLYLPSIITSVLEIATLIKCCIAIGSKKVSTDFLKEVLSNIIFLQ